MLLQQAFLCSLGRQGWQAPCGHCPPPILQDAILLKDATHNWVGAFLPVTVPCVGSLWKHPCRHTEATDHSCGYFLIQSSCQTKPTITGPEEHQGESGDGEEERSQRLCQQFLGVWVSGRYGSPEQRSVELDGSMKGFLDYGNGNKH